MRGGASNYIRRGPARKGGPDRQPERAASSLSANRDGRSNPRRAQGRPQAAAKADSSMARTGISSDAQGCELHLGRIHRPHLEAALVNGRDPVRFESHLPAAGG